MIPARVDAHIDRRRHVAVGAFGALRSRRMVMMARLIEDRRRMALAAKRVSREAQLARMRIVAIRTCDAGRMHAALQEGAEIIDFVALLAVEMIEPGFERHRPEGVEETRRRDGIVGELLAPRMTAGANARFLVACRRACPGRRRAGARRPGYPGALIQADVETMMRRLRRRFRRPFDMSRRRAVAGLAAHADFGKGRGESVGGRIVILTQIG